MGEARRRKLAGTYPGRSDPIEAARRFWCGSSSAGPVEDFRAPAGTAMVHAEAFVDLEGFTAGAPKDSVIAIEAIRDAGRTQH